MWTDCWVGTQNNISETDSGPQPIRGNNPVKKTLFPGSEESHKTENSTKISVDSCLLTSPKGQVNLKTFVKEQAIVCDKML